MRLNRFAMNLIDMKDMYNKNSNPLIKESFIKFLDEIKGNTIDENIYSTFLDNDISIIEFTSLLKDYSDFIKSKKEIMSDMKIVCNDMTALINSELNNLKEKVNFQIESDYETEKFNIIFQIIIPNSFFYSYFDIENTIIKESDLSKFYDMFIILRLNKYLDLFFEKNNIDNKLQYKRTNFLKNEKENFERVILFKREMTLIDYYNEKVRDTIIKEILEVSCKMNTYFYSLDSI